MEGNTGSLCLNPTAYGSETGHQAEVVSHNGKAIFD
jgi:hypothetical protein